MHGARPLSKFFVRDVMKLDAELMRKLLLLSVPSIVEGQHGRQHGTKISTPWALKMNSTATLSFRTHCFGYEILGRNKRGNASKILWST